MHSEQKGLTDVKGSILHVVAAKTKSTEDRDQRPIDNSECVESPYRPVRDEEYVLTYS